ncbi:MAG: glycosyltransferase family 4 protein [Patescibacteria group bacterium]|jgi:glycosyltransferase involved in cell wall biosynthesis
MIFKGNQVVLGLPQEGYRKTLYNTFMRIAMIGQKGVEIGSRGGGIETHVAELSERLVKKGHEITVFCRAKYSPKKPMDFKGVHLRYPKTIYTKHLEAIIHTFFSTIVVMFGTYDIVHYHGVGPSTLAFLPRLFRPHMTVIATFHARDRLNRKWGWFARNFLAFGERTAVWFPHYCIAVSHDIQVYCRDYLGREVVYIPNGANVQEVAESNELEKFSLTPHEYLLTVGRLVPAKGLHYLIEAFRGIETNQQLVIVGAPSFTDAYLESLHALAGGDERIRFLGYQSGEILRQLFAHAYLYIQPSEIEGLPLVVLEAMSYGLPPLVSDIAPNIEAIHGAGFIFKTQDANDLRVHLEELLAHPEMVAEKSAEAKEIIATHFNWDVIADHTDAVYISARH